MLINLDVQKANFQVRKTLEFYNSRRTFIRWATHCGKSYKQFTLVIYNSRVVIWGIFKSGTTLES